MTKQQLNQRSRDMLQMLIPEIKQECKRLIASGALEYSKEDMRSFRTAKTVLTVALENVAASHLNYFDAADIEERRNLRNF